MSPTTKLLSLAVTLALAGAANAAPTDLAVGRALGLLQSHGNFARVSHDDRFVARDVVIDRDGSEHVRFDRSYHGLPVIGGDVVMHSKGGRFESASLTQRSALSLATTPSLDRSDAIVAAGARFGSDFVGMPTAELVVYARGQGMPQLAYRVGFQGNDRDGNPVDMSYVVNARNGALLDQWSNLETATGTGKSLYSGNVSLTTTAITGGYQLKDASRGGGYTLNGGTGITSGKIYTDADNTWGNNSASDPVSAAVDAQFGIATTWDYYKNVQGRNGIANDGKGAYNRVHYGRKYSNAFWSDSCFCMTYGDGDGVTIGSLVALDIAGHEMSHGVTARTANLTYSGESGGLNEANSDIMGTMVEYYANNASDAGDYLIGEKIFVSNPNGTRALRYMFKPSIDGGSPDCYVGTIGSLDVHYSSGVANHFYYLLAEGAVVPAGFGQYTPSQLVCNGNTALVAIGRDAASKIWYRALTVYMISNTDYAGARAATISAAGDLFGANSAQQNAVKAAWSAVSVN